MKVDKSFIPPKAEENDEFYPNGIFEFNITKLLAFITQRSDEFPVEEVSVKSVRPYAPSLLDEDTIRSANLSRPIIIAEISPHRFNVIDGNHRLEKAHREGMDAIQAYRVRSPHHSKFLTSASAYLKYIDYWNSKIDGLDEID